MDVNKNSSTIVSICVVTLLILTLNHVLAFVPLIQGYTGLIRNVMYNAVYLLIYVILGWTLTRYTSIGKVQVMILSVSIFFFEHVILKAVHLVILEKLEELFSGLETLLLSFLFFTPVIVLLTFLGSWIAKKTTIKEG